jgi:hypothetical protein
MDYNDYLELIEQEADPDIRKINIMNLDFNPQTK